MLEKINKNLHFFSVGNKNLYKEKLKIFLASDLHWDNPKCDRKKLKSDLDHAVKENAIILLNGDTFCLMQGKYDPRRTKSDIRPEHNSNTYIDDVVNDAIKWFKPYKKHIKLIGRGNHEQGVRKNTETDIINRFAEGLGIPEVVGGYGGIFHINFGQRANFVINYYHGSGGGGINKGVTQFQRRRAFTEGSDVIWMGHVHESYEAVSVSQTYNTYSKKIELKNIYEIRTSTYKEEYGTGSSGYHIENDRPPKHLGGRMMELEFKRSEKIKVKTYLI